MARLVLVLFLTRALGQNPDDPTTTTTTASPGSSFQRAASSQMGTGQVPAAGGNAAAAAHRRREQEQGYEEALASTLGSSGNTGQAFSAAGDAYFAAGDAYSAAGGAASSHRRREHAGFLEPHHQAPGVVAGHHTLADILMPGHAGQFGHDLPNRIGYGGHMNDPYIDEIGSAMPFGDPMPYGHADHLPLVDTLAHGHPLGGAFPYNSPSDARPHTRPLDPRPYSGPSVENLYGYGSPLKHRPYGSSVDSRPFHSGSIRDLRPYGRHQDCPQTCDLKAWPRCQCLSPATYSDDGRGNCNVGAMNNDLQVWCYVDPSIGNPLLVCPDSRPSDSKPGYFWSRFACITETVE